MYQFVGTDPALADSGQSGTLLNREGSHYWGFSWKGTKGLSKAYVHQDQNGSNPLSTYLPTYLPTYQPTNQPTYLSTYLSAIKLHIRGVAIK